MKWGKEKKYNNHRFDSWRASIVKDIIAKDPTLSKLHKSIPNHFLEDHWIGKPMRSEYHSLIHFYRLAQTFKKTVHLVNEDSSLLDVGCASGLFLLLWSNKKKQGIDQLKGCCNFGDKNGLNIIHGDADSLPFSANKFDIVFLLEIIEHVSNPFKVIEEAKRVSSDKIICTFPVFENTNIKPFDRKQHFKNDSHYLELTDEDFINLMTHLSIEKYEYESINIWHELSIQQKILSYVSGFQWPKWHLFIAN